MFLRKNILKQIMLFILGWLLFIPAGHSASAEESSIQLTCAYFTYQWEFIHDYIGNQPNGKMKVKVRCHNNGATVNGSRRGLFSFTCTPVGNVSFGDDVATFDGVSSYVRCDHPLTLKQLVEQVINQPVVNMPVLASYPGFWVNSNASPTPQTGFDNPVVSFAVPSGTIEFLTPVSSGTSPTGTMGIELNNAIIESPNFYFMNELSYFYYWQSECDPIAGTACAMRFYMNSDDLGSGNIVDAIKFPTDEPLQFLIGGNPTTGRFFKGEIHDVRVDPGCFTPPGPGCTAG